MKNLNMRWDDIKNTPRYELEALLVGVSEYNILHSFDGYSPQQVNDMAKNQPNVRQQYADYQERRRRYGLVETNKVKSFHELV
tara:strand:+ start:346 stop:594 length:249 start_codon:yes stop_codon:yes gene_type:complete